MGLGSASPSIYVYIVNIKCVIHLIHAIVFEFLFGIFLYGKNIRNHLQKHLSIFFFYHEGKKMDNLYFFLIKDVTEPVYMEWTVTNSVRSTVKTICATLKMEAVLAVNQDGGIHSVIKARAIFKIRLHLIFFKIKCCFLSQWNAPFIISYISFRFYVYIIRMCRRKIWFKVSSTMLRTL